MCSVLSGQKDDKKKQRYQQQLSHWWAKNTLQMV